MRTFIALPLDQQVRDAARSIQMDLKKINCNIKWVEPQNLHLTLKFLGDIDVKQVEPILQAMQETLQGFQPMETEVTGIGAFPRIEHARVIWMGLKDEKNQIADLASGIETSLAKLGFPKEKRGFSPHMTLGRVRSPKNLHLLAEAMAKVRIPVDVKQIINEVHLYKSTLTPQGPVYNNLGTVTLFPKNGIK